MLFLSLNLVLAYLLLASTWCFTANADLATDALSQIPACGVSIASPRARIEWLTVAQLQCIAENLPAIGCGLTDVACQCNSKNSTKILQPCLEELCTYDQTFGTLCHRVSGVGANAVAEILRVQATLCDRPHDSLGVYIKLTAYITGIIPVVVIIMRFTSRHLGGNNFWWDDWIHLASAVSVQASGLLNFAYLCTRSWSSR
jgi:hypothetical protein